MTTKRKRRKILVTGGAGFIASHVVDKCVSLGYSVAVIDNLSTGFKKNLNPDARFYKGDIRNLAFVERVLKKERPDVINHHAAVAEVVKSVRNPLKTLEINVIGTVNLLLTGGRGSMKKFIFASTGGAVYGEAEKVPVSEKAETAPLSPYGLSKLLAEETISFYARSYGFEYLILRYPNVYGPRQNPKGEAGIVAIFAGLIKEGKRPTIFGDGTKTRDYVYIDDIVKANVTGLRRGKNEIVNLGWSKEVSDQKMFDAIAKSLDFKKSPIYAPFRQGEICRIALKANKVQKILNWRPKIKLDEGIGKTIRTIG